ncbi:MAG: hypothetical protein KGJ06_02400 [Pseudomonadota bacterium]|nr:hypothetical protein [Pseudomonadota bacterium]
MPLPPKIILTRDALYEAVWSTPMAQLAKQYNLSDVGLAKICRKMEIPYPWRGYWAKVTNGQVLPKTPLKPLTGKGRSQFILYGNCPPRAASTESEFEKRPENVIAVSKTLHNPHPLVAETKRLLEDTQVRYGALARQPGCLDISVSKEPLRRALLLMDAIAKAAIARGYEIAIATRESRQAMCLQIDGEPVYFSLTETIRSSAHIPTRQEKTWKSRIDRLSYGDYYHSEYERYRAKVPDYDYTPEGIFQLRIEHRRPEFLRRKWADGKAQRVENCLNQFFASAKKVAEAEKEWRLEWERKQREWREAEERRRLLEEQRQAEKKKVKWLKKELKNWKTSRRIRKYIAAIRAANPDPTPELAEWLSWAERYADHLDPMVDFEIDVLKEIRGRFP